ncbi:PEP-CTERM protein-sorting domain-containing protein [Nitrosospira sp. Nsp14]|uniref:PEP-CTERM sorting domain-containing protein n=1 Tax=Nitrosospira sp. Nsp14 TaxID=1855333 RepID=UPI0008DFAEA4|nr:PEP-CTERM sorting domain-containing protein [Nitrosospira sp. Nsp14]SFH37129.1 PEP-CTERM protein-sorting domain-containing protein [Nitrosospira sp. Nsp14]
MKTRVQPLLAGLFMAGLSAGAHAAYFERVDYLATGGYSAATNGDSVSDAVTDLSPAWSDVALFGANLYNASLTGGLLEHSYATDAFLSFSVASMDLTMTLSHSLSAASSGGLNVPSHQQDAFIDLTAATLTIVAGLGEANGSAVQVSFAGDASALYDVHSMVSGGCLGLGLSVSRGNDVVGEYLWDVQQGGDQPVSFSFAGVVGEELSFSSFMLTGASLENAYLAPNASPYTLVEAGALLSGSFSIAVVPEPETYAMFLAGLGLLGFMSRSSLS